MQEHLLPVGGLSLGVHEAGVIAKPQFLLGSILWSKRRLLSSTLVQVVSPTPSS